MTVIQEDCIRVRASGLVRNTVGFSREFPRTGVCIRAFLASRALDIASLAARAAFEILWFAPLYGSVPINHLVHGPTIRLHERGSYYPARLWWCTTSRTRLWTLSLRQTRSWAARKFRNVLRNGESEVSDGIRNVMEFHISCINVNASVDNRIFVIHLILKRLFYRNLIWC